jgi:hypothetical protein
MSKDEEIFIEWKSKIIFIWKMRMSHESDKGNERKICSWFHELEKKSMKEGLNERMK